LYESGILTFGLMQADRYFDGLIDRLEDIAAHPYRFQSVDFIRSGYRRSIYGSHAIYFRVIVDDLLIARILGRQHLQTALRG